MQHDTKKLTAVLVAIIVGAAGCADGNEMSGVPTGPAFDGIGWAGSGNRSDTTQVTTTTTTTSSTTSGSEPTAGIGFTGGSGN